MRNFYTSSIDTTLYQQFPNQNTGLDEILSVGKSDSGSFAVRSLLQFDLTQLSQSLSNGAIPITAKYDLLLYIADAGQLNRNQIVEIKPVSESWVEGSGYFYQTPIFSTDGASWNYKSTGSLWAVSGSSTQSFGVSQNIASPITDMVFDISLFVLSWISGTYPNNGMVIKFPDADEGNLTNIGFINFFSNNTHTIYSPKICAKWIDQVYNTGSLSSWPSQSLLVEPINLHSKYYQDEVVRVNLLVREHYPLKTFDTVFTNFNGIRYLPTSSYYSIVDKEAKLTIIPFDVYSAISVDNNGSYFIFPIQNMYPERYYSVLIKVVHDGFIEIFDSNEVFGVND